MSKRFTTLELLDPDFRRRVERVQVRVSEAGLPLLVYETIRSPNRQAELYARGRGDPDSVDFGRRATNAKPYQSAHQYGLAVDFVFQLDGKWTWEPPHPEDWDLFHIIARGEGLVPLTSEKPHVQSRSFIVGMRGGPLDEVGWAQWLRRRNLPPIVAQIE